MYTKTQLILINFLSKVIKLGFWFFWCVGIAYISSKIFGYDFERIQGLGLFMAWVLLRTLVPPREQKITLQALPIQIDENEKE